MSQWALNQGASLLPWLIISAFFVTALWETVAPERPFQLSQWRRWSQQASLFATGTLLSRLCLPIGSVAVASWSQHAQWGLWNALGLPAGLTLVAALLSLDLGNYLSHRVFHHVPCCGASTRSTIRISKSIAVQPSGITPWSN